MRRCDNCDLPVVVERPHAPHYVHVHGTVECHDNPKKRAMVGGMHAPEVGRG